MALAHPNVDAAFAAQVARTPDAAAVLDASRTLTYAQLDRRARADRARLRGAGAGPEQVVAVALPRSADLIAALLGVLRAGAVYLPLDLAHPAARRELVLADGGAAIAIAERASAGELPATACGCWCSTRTRRGRTTASRRGRPAPRPGR